MSSNEIVDKSVTKNDFTDDAGKKGGVYHFWASPWWTMPGALQPTPPPYWSFTRDAILRTTIHHESIWAGAIYVATTKMAALAWKVKGLELRSRKTREMLLEADGYQGWVHFIQRHLQDFLLTDNGAFIEVVRTSGAAGSKILGIMHLDSNRCMRTGDPDIPVIFRDRKNIEHELKAHQVICLADMPSAADLYYGVGTCAASRAYRDIYKLASIENYTVEKVTGRSPLALHFVNNISFGQVNNAITAAETERVNKGYVAYMGAYIIPTVDPTTAPQVATLNMAGLPEGYQIEDERRACKLSYANAIGLDPQEVDPQLLASRALGTGAQARVIDDKASGKGLAAWRNNFSQLLNEFVVPEETTFYFKESDMRDQLQTEQVKSQRTTTLAAMSAAQFITPNQGTQLLVDAEDIPPEFLVEPDTTPVEENSSEMKPTNAAPGEVTSMADTPPSPEADYGDVTQLSAAQLQGQQQQQLAMEQQAQMQPSVDENGQPIEEETPPTPKAQRQPKPGSEQGQGTRAMYEPREQPQAKKVKA